MVDLTGKKEADAKSTLSDLKLVANVGYTEDNSKDDGVVLKQSIEVGKVVDEGTTVTITVNKKQEMKTVPITVNVKSLLNGDIMEKTTTTTGTTSDDNTTEKVKEVTLKVDVGSDTIYSQKVKASETNLSVGNAKGTGTTTVKVYIDGVLKNQDTLNYSTMKNYIVEKSN